MRRRACWADEVIESASSKIMILCLFWLLFIVLFIVFMIEVDVYCFSKLKSSYGTS